MDQLITFSGRGVVFHASGAGVPWNTRRISHSTRNALVGGERQPQDVVAQRLQ